MINKADVSILANDNGVFETLVRVKPFSDQQVLSLTRSWTENPDMPMFEKFLQLVTLVLDLKQYQENVQRSQMPPVLCNIFVGFIQFLF